MKKEPQRIRFHNFNNPQSRFDLLKVEELFRRETPDHNPELLHKVDFFLILLLTEGEGIHSIDFTDHPYQQGSLFTIRKDQIHHFTKTPEAKGYMLLFTDDFLLRYLDKSEVQKSFQLFNELIGSPKIQLSEEELGEILGIVERMGKEYFQLNDSFSSDVIRSELHILITKLYRIKSQKNQMIQGKKYLDEFIRFQELVEEKVTQTNRVQDYADMMGLSSKTLTNISKSILNKTAKEFIDEINIKQIKRLLINTPHSVKEIAYASGFEETTNFYKYFKRHVQLTPEQFRADFS
ncbi:MAG: helix-turn-helix transcriptional regulator [Bacteroidota bacterium]